jgi:hypothetical protein
MNSVRIRGLLQNQHFGVVEGWNTGLGLFLVPRTLLALSLASQDQGGGKTPRSEWLSLIAEIMVAVALVLATLWYAYNTRRLADEQNKAFLLNKRIWEASRTPRIWFNLTRTETTLIYLTASNLGGDVAQNIVVQIETCIVKFEWKWPCILPEEQVIIDLPDEISYIENLKDIEYFQIEGIYSDSELQEHKIQQRIDTRLMVEGMKTSLRHKHPKGD